LEPSKIAQACAEVAKRNNHTAKANVGEVKAIYAAHRRNEKRFMFQACEKGRFQGNAVSLAEEPTRETSWLVG